MDQRWKRSVQLNETRLGELIFRLNWTGWPKCSRNRCWLRGAQHLQFWRIAWQTNWPSWSRIPAPDSSERWNPTWVRPGRWRHRRASSPNWECSADKPVTFHCTHNHKLLLMPNLRCAMALWLSMLLLT